MNYSEWVYEASKSGWFFTTKQQKQILADWQKDSSEWKAKYERLKTELETLKQNG